MKFADLKNSTFERYDNEMYANDKDTQNVLNLFKKAEALSPAAQAEFVKVYNFEHAIDGLLYLGSKKSAPALYPNLTNEAGAAGIEIITR